MSDNFPETPGSGRNVATDQVTYSGDTADVQLMRPVLVTGSEGSKTVVDLQGQQTMANSLPVTLASNQTALPVTDNAGSLTVDAPAGTPVFARLSDGTSAIPADTANGLDVDVTRQKHGEATPATATWTSATAQDTALTLTVSGYATVGVWIDMDSGSASAGVLTFEATADGSVWYEVEPSHAPDNLVALSAVLVADVMAWAPGTVPYRFAAHGATQFRVRLQTAITGTVTLGLRLAATSAASADVFPLGRDASTGLAKRLRMDAGGRLIVVTDSAPVAVTDNAGSLTVDDGGGAISVDDNGGNLSIDDGGNSITVDAPAGTPVFVRLSDGTSALTTSGGRLAVDASGAAVPVTDNSGSLTVDNAGTFAVQETQVVADNAGFTDGTTKVFPAGYILDETPGTSLTENDTAAARIDSKRAQVLTIEDATTRGQRATVSAGGALKVDGSAVTQPVSDAGGSITVDAPAGTPVFVRLSDGASPITALPVTDNAGSLTVDNGGTFTVQDSEKVTDNAGFTDGATKVLPVAFIFDETAGTALTENDAAAARIDSKRAQIGVLEDATTRGQRAAVSAAGRLSVDASGVAVPVTDNSGSLTVDAPAGTPVFVRLSDGASPVSALPVTDNAGSLTVDNGGTFAVQDSEKVTEDAAAAADPKGFHTMLRRKDTLSTSEVSTDGDVIAAQATNKGELYVKHVDSVPVTDNGGNLSIDDGGNSITVDAPASTPVFVRLSDGAAAISALPVTDNSGSLTVDNGGTFVVQDSEKVADNAGFTDGATKVLPAGFIYDEIAGTVLSENDAAAARIDSKRAQVLVIEDSAARGQRASVDTNNGLKVSGTSISTSSTWSSGASVAVSADVTGMGAVMVVGVGSSASGAQTATFEMSVDGGTWIAVGVLDMTSASGAVVTSITGTAIASTTVAYQFPPMAGSRQARVKLSANLTSGTVAWTLVGQNVAASRFLTNVADGGNSLTVDSTQLPSGLVGGRLDVNIGNSAATVPVSNGGTFAVQAASAGDVAHDAGDSGNPVKTGFKAINALPTAVSNADRANGVSDLWGRQMTTHIDPAQQITKSFNATSTQTGTDVWSPTSGKKIAVTSVVIGTYGTTAGRVILWFGDNADTTYTAGTDQLLLAFSTAPSSTSKPGLVFTPLVPIFCTTADRELHITTDAAVSIDIAVHGYEW
jgi:hypothetical protein